jgi:hypothetical protein
MTKLEYILTNTYKVGMVSYLNEHPEDFEEVIELAIADRQPYSWRAASLVKNCMEQNDERLRGYLDRIIDLIPTKREGHARELLVIVQQMDLNEDQEGKVFDLCVNLWEKTGNQPSVRHNAFRQMCAIAKKHPDLIHEIELLTDSMYMESLSPGVKRAIQKMMNGLKKEWEK